MGRETAAISPRRRRELEEGCIVCGRSRWFGDYCLRHAPNIIRLSKKPVGRPLTDKLDAVFNFIVAFKQANDGNSPSIRAIGAAVGVKETSQISVYLGKLSAAHRISVDGTPYAQNAIAIPGGRWRYNGPETDNPLLLTIIAYKATNDGNSPSLRYLAEQREERLSDTRRAVLVLEAAGLVSRLRLGQSNKPGPLVVVGGRWEYEGEGARP